MILLDGQSANSKSNRANKCYMAEWRCTYPCMHLAARGKGVKAADGSEVSTDSDAKYAAMYR